MVNKTRGWVIDKLMKSSRSNGKAFFPPVSSVAVLKWSEQRDKSLVFSDISLGINYNFVPPTSARMIVYEENLASVLSI